MISAPGCSEGTDPSDAIAGDYPLRLVQFSSSPLQPVPALEAVQDDTTVVEEGELTLAAGGGAFLRLVYRWRYAGVPGGETVQDTLSYLFHERLPFRSYGLVDYFLLLRGPHHIAYLLRQDSGRLILIDYDRAGTMDFYFYR